MPVQTTGSQFCQEVVVQGHVKSLTKVQIHNIHSLSLIHHVRCLVTEGDLVHQVGPDCHKSTLSGPDPLVVLDMPFYGPQDYLLQDPPRTKAILIVCSFPDTPYSLSSQWASHLPASCQAKLLQSARTTET